MDRSFHKVVSSHILRFAIAMRAFTSLEQSPSVDLKEPIYLNCFTFSTGSLLTRMVMSSGTSPMVMSFVFLTFSLSLHGQYYLENVCLILCSTLPNRLVIVCDCRTRYLLNAHKDNTILPADPTIPCHLCPRRVRYPCKSDRSRSAVLSVPNAQQFSRKTDVQNAHQIAEVKWILIVSVTEYSTTLSQTRHENSSLNVCGCIWFHALYQG